MMFKLRLDVLSLSLLLLPTHAVGAELSDPTANGNFVVGPDYAIDPDLTDRGNTKGKAFEFSMPLAESKIFPGTDETLDARKEVRTERQIYVYIPAAYKDGDKAPLLVTHDGPSRLDLVRNALDNLTISRDPQRRLPAFVVIAVQNGGNDGKGSERGLEYDTMSDRFARFINDEVLPAVVSNKEIRDAYPNFALTDDPWGKATMGCSSGGAAALTMGWFRPDLFRRLITYSGTFVDQQDDDAPQEANYPLGAWEYHSGMKLIENSEKKPLRIFTHVSEFDNRANDPEETYHNWVMANERTADALKAKGYDYRYVFSRGTRHCDKRVFEQTLADTLVWAWHGYEPDEVSVKRPEVNLPAGVKLERDIAYLEDGDESQRLDIYLPEQPSEKPLPLVVHIHGGGWRAGNKFPCPVANLASQGFAVASVEYRFSQKEVFPAQIQDCQAAIRWLRGNSEKYNFDPDHFAVVGGSAGGHLSALVGTSGGKNAFPKIGEHQDQSDSVQCVCDIFGPANFASVIRQAEEDQNVRNIFNFNTPSDPYSSLIGVALNADENKTAAVSPIHYVSSQSPPMLIFHGTHDALVPYAQSLELQAALKAQGVDVWLQTFPGSGHGGPAFNHPKVKNLMKTFFDKYLKGDDVTIELVPEDELAVQPPEKK